MEEWRKLDEPFLPYPPEGLKLTGWRDPFIVPSKEFEGKITMLLGSGFVEQGGAVLKYSTSQSLMKGWKYDGVVLQHHSNKFGDVWECPVLVPVAPVSGCKNVLSSDNEGTVSTHNHGKQDSNVDGKYDNLYVLMVGIHFPHERQPKYQPVIYWLGNLSSSGEFRPHNSSEPQILDLGRIGYAPNAMIDQHGRTIMWLWMHEGKCPDSIDYSGCLSVPRILSVMNGKLCQMAIPDLETLRKGEVEILADTKVTFTFIVDQ